MPFITLHRLDNQEPLDVNSDHIMYLESRKSDDSTNVALSNRETLRMRESREEILTLVAEASALPVVAELSVTAATPPTPEVPQDKPAMEVPEDKPDNPAKKRETK